jgi:hypothetical protein
VEQKTGPQLRYTFEYDTLHPEEKLRKFVMDIQEMKSRYEQNLLRIKEIENALCDIEHYMEISSFKNVPEGYKLYRKLAGLRRERRALKSENDILRPAVEYFRTTSTLDKIANVQGDVAKSQEIVDSRVYTVRTDALDEWLKPEEEVKKPVMKLMSIEEAVAE